MGLFNLDESMGSWIWIGNPTQNENSNLHKLYLMNFSIISFERKCAIQ